jgi:penicillin-binding protein-related factor A (putative recombinase)
MGLEQNLWKWLKKEVQPLVAQKDLHICRVENPVGPGYPDVEGCYKGIGFHLELKAVERPKKNETLITLRHMRQRQIIWLEKRWRAGGSAWVLLRIGQREGARIYLLPGNTAARLREGVLERSIDAISEIHPQASGCMIIYAVIKRPVNSILTDMVANYESRICRGIPLRG